MALFPAYAPPGSSKGRGRSQAQQRSISIPEPKCKDDDDDVKIIESGTSSFVIDKKGGRGGKDTGIITIDEVVSSDGELPSGSGEEVVPEPQPTSSSSKRSKDKKSHKRKRSRSRDRSKGKKRTRSSSSSIEEVDNGHHSRDRDQSHKKKKSKKSSRDRHRDRDRHGNHDSRYDRNREDNRDGGRGNRDYMNDYYQRQERGQHDHYEQQRVRIAKDFPRKVFLEEVNLKPEYAFRVDSDGNWQNLKSYSLSNFQKSYYQYGQGCFGATQVEIDRMYNKFSKFRCRLPQGIDESGNPVDKDEESENVAKSLSKKGKGKTSSSATEVSVKNATVQSQGNRAALKCDTFISFGKGSKEKDNDNRRYDGRVDVREGFESLSFPRKDGELSLKDKIEKYNSDLREQPQNIGLWKEFIEFQDQVFEEASQIYDYQDGEQQAGNPNKKGSKKKRNRKALLEKKVAIIDKALQSNTRNLDLNLLRLDLMLEAYKPGHVLQEWKNIVANHQQVTPFWVEYLRFASTQLQVYSSNSLNSVFEKCFQKFRQMLNPSFPDFQRPGKFSLVIADLIFALSLTLKNAGFREKAIALHQGQLELDFFCPTNLLIDKSQVDWKGNRQVFEMFWDIGTPRFGEPGAQGWSIVTKAPKASQKSVMGIPESKLSDFEDLFFEGVNNDEDGKPDATSSVEEMKHKHWLTIEYTRSKLQWLPWRANCSDVEDVEDSQRIVLSSDIASFLSPVPIVPYIPDFDRHSAYFRHVVNSLITLQEDFIPQTQTLNSVVSAFTAISLTESRSLFSELFYWRKMLSFYLSNTSANQANQDSSLVKTPEGFKVLDLMSANPVITSGLSKTKNKIELSRYSDKLEKSKEEILNENYTNHVTMIRSVVDKSIDVLEAPFSSLLFEMYLRFEQKNSFASLETRKIRLKHAKNLMKKEKLRNSMGCFREMAMLQYFQGKTAIATGLLVKTINLGCTTLTLDESDNFDLKEDWEKVTELTKLYTQLAEFYLQDNQPMAYHILSLLGAGFKSVNIDLKEEELVMKTNVMLKALRLFEKIFAILLPGDTEEVEMERDEDESMELKEALDKWDGTRSVEYLVQKPSLIIEWTKAYALFQFLAKDFEAASDVIRKALARVKVPEPLSRSSNYDHDLINRHNIREQLYITWCNLGALALSKNPMMNAKFRSILGLGLQEYPSSPALLLLFTDVENQMSIAGKLWRMMVGVVKQDGGCNHWSPLFMGIGLANKIEELEHDEEIGLDSFGIGGPAVPPDTIFYKLDSLLTAAQQNSRTRNCPLIWRVHLKLLALRAQEGKDVKRARATFYDAVRHCPSVKAIYLDGVTYFPDMLKEITDLMGEKQLYVRLPVEELDVLLEIENEVKGLDQGQEVVTISDEEDSENEEDGNKSDGEV